MSAHLVLVVDDSRSARYALRKYLEGHAFSVDTVDSAQSAYLWLGDHLPDLIFLDHVMPGEDGFAAMRRIKSDPRTADIPIVICSSNEGSAFVAEARSQGAVDVLPKPPNPDQLKRVLEQLSPVTAAAPTPTVTTPEAPPPAQPSAATDDATALVVLQEAVTVLKRQLITLTGDAAETTATIENRIDTLEARLSGLAKNETSRQNAQALDALRAQAEQRIEALRSEHAKDLERLRHETESAIRQAIEAADQRRQEDRDAQRKQFDSELRAVHQQFRDELERATQSARQQAIAEVRATLIRALGG